ncbi:hypothetical protein M3J09_000429 [Ascochyta lentis]
MWRLMLCIPCKEASRLGDDQQIFFSLEMAEQDQSQRMKRTEIAPSASINSLIDAANSNDRFKLLEDDAVLPANLTNPVHPIFHQLEGEAQLHLALQLASHFLLHDRLLEFFVPLVFGSESFDLQCRKVYLCDPLLKASKAKQAQLLSDVRKALDCLAQRIEFGFVNHKKERLYARTIANDVKSMPTSSCCRAFQGEVSPKIELTNKFLQYYNSADGYVAASRCARYRHDFLFATTLVHEVVHAVGVMRRGNVDEPHYRPDFPETEWGYAWENFMFGSIINPQDKTRPGTHLLMRKVWADPKLADANGGKEYSDVPVSWIAQWFRNKTWDIVAKQGPTAITPPTAHFKIQISHELGAWVVSSECPDVRKSIADLYKRWQMYDRRVKCEELALDGSRASNKIYHSTVTAAELQGSNVPIPQRQPRNMDKPHYASNAPLIAVCRATSPYNTRKRRGSAYDESDKQSMSIKRLCTHEHSQH